MHAPSDTGDPRSPLSPREREVLRLLAQGYTNQQIAQWISVSVKTAETYRSRIGEKLGVRGRAELTRYAFESGLLTPDRVSPEDYQLALR